MRDLFPGYYAPQDFQPLWGQATFVLDANVLLSLYRFPKSAAEDLLDVLDPDPLLLETRKLFNEFQSNLDQLEKDQPDVSDRDEIRDRIDKLLLGRVGPPPKSQPDLDQIY